MDEMLANEWVRFSIPGVILIVMAIIITKGAVIPGWPFWPRKK